MGFIHFISPLSPESFINYYELTVHQLGLQTVQFVIFPMSALAELKQDIADDMHVATITVWNGTFLGKNID